MAIKLPDEGLFVIMSKRKVVRVMKKILGCIRKADQDFSLIEEGDKVAVGVSGGKDSHYQVYLMKEVMHMNPILFSVEDNFKMTEAGKHNIKNISEAFGCNIISLKPDIKTKKKLMKYTDCFWLRKAVCYVLQHV